ncbi:MAG: DsbE family thiol:disulfide interchange protein [Rhodanobacteraceae bacterium]|nr:DsbE family thiol:disulfide interchange protein [Xanthomonadales bacterium]MCP5478905.1 DsbE family thiol:disulfide interchange protein [Rhodanobacteraceae bacterium]HPF73543.1 DsbE family thiol:disulfide interchange protein [Xanthomonadaceae bacterium]HRY00012.1 DsbE family thiol:disulfide interchange protein [Xanthomonadaceae bacterium]
MLRRVLPLIVFIALGVLMLVGIRISADRNPDALPTPLLNQPAPGFSLPELHQPERTVSSEELAGTPYLLNVWGSWCPSCRIEHPVVTRLAQSGKLRVIGYNYKDERDDALRWLGQFGDPYEMIVVDEDGRTAIDWGIYGAPETFLVDADGIIRFKLVGPLSDDIIEKDILPRLGMPQGKEATP